MLAPVALALVGGLQDPLPTLDLLPEAASEERRVVAFLGADPASEALAETLRSLAPLDDPLEVTRVSFAADSEDGTRLRTAWSLGEAPVVAFLDGGGRALGSPVGPDDFARTYLERLARPRLVDAALPPAGLVLIPRDGVDVLVAWEELDSPREESRVDLEARWMGPGFPARDEPFEARSGCDVPDGSVLVRPFLRVAGSPAAPRPVEGLYLGMNRTGAPLAVPAEPLELAVRGGRFEPPVLLVPAGSPVRFVNRDGCGHAVHLYSLRNAQLNASLAPGGELTHTFERREPVRVADDLHPWMEAWLLVTDSPHVAPTDAEGRLRLTAPPVGLTDLGLWHPDPRVGRLRLPMEGLPGDDLRLRAWFFGAETEGD